MRLYSGTTKQFVEDSYRNQIAEKLKLSFFEQFRFNPSDSEVRSWQNSLRAISQTLEHTGLSDNGIILEYQLPLTSKRLDVLLTGKDDNNNENAIIIELKQWDKCANTTSPNEVITFIGGGMREVLHPSVQVGQYHIYLLDTHTVFYDEDAINLSSCSYLHNYHSFEGDELNASKFNAWVTRFPVYTADDVLLLSSFIKEKIGNGQGMDILNKVEQSEYRPSKKLMDHVGNVIKGKKEYILLDEQLVAYDKVFTSAKEGFHNRKKTVVIIKGGPGTGKSVIALNLMADLSLEGFNTHYSTGSKAFTETLRKIVGPRGATQLKYFNSYIDAPFNSLDVLIADEAHRIRKTSNHRFMRADQKSNKLQIEELINTAKVPVFLIDDDQIVRPNEIGSVDLIKQYAKTLSCEIFEYELEAQFRCAGSNGFVNWINNTLGIKKTANVLWDQNELFDFKVFSSPQEVEDEIRKKAGDGLTARMTAGFCWEWSKNLKQDRTLIEDVRIGDYIRPWNAQHNATNLAPGIPKAHHWAYDDGGIDQIGCVYTAQGFEFDYVGVIFGLDLKYNMDKQQWEGFTENSYDHVVKRSGDKFIDLVKNTYRVLLSRGMKGCYVHFMDKDTE
ncbi:MAG: DUF2075 domain-containing protein, partial [Candidatus Marinimicrobia bacterium]|nr:DUF2075 domain-containing protein [Candidatus Neomarinimicrobiota bacterium]MBT3962421.1 DUF2075 domain-containing protein [Candidatus Neomarinimicrobiota bacterium]